MITPTIGRVVWYYPALPTFDGHPDPEGQPLAAHIAHVWGDRMVNLMVIDANGEIYNKTSVTLVQEGDLAPVEWGRYCEWMPYQKGQAAKTEALQSRIETFAGEKL
jgi:hypothetical protein